MGEGWPSRRKYISMNVTFFAALAAFAIVLIAVLLYKPGEATAADVKRLAVGMTPDEVTAILGEPNISVQSRVVPGNPEETWTYYLAGSRWSVKRQTWQLKFYHGQLDSWWMMK